MEKYIVNGVEIEYDTFDVDSLEAWDAAVRRVAEESEAVLDGESQIDKLRRICGAMLDMFDDTCGEGTAARVFGERVNVKQIYEGYDSFVLQVRQTVDAFSAERTQAPMNREQRRAAARNDRRAVTAGAR